jgi:hypothetical protein
MIVNDYRIFNASDHFDGAAFFTARFDVDIKTRLRGCPTPIDSAPSGIRQLYKTNVPGQRRPKQAPSDICMSGSYYLTDVQWLFPE